MRGRKLATIHPVGADGKQEKIAAYDRIALTDDV